MPDLSKAAIRELSQRYQIDADFLSQCVQESVVEIHESEGQWDLGNGTILRLRQLERICTTLDIGLSGALVVMKLTRRVTELEDELRLLKKQD